jgi:hypothetical protein
MKIITKRLKVIQMTSEEIAEFHALMKQAAEGHTSHYAEKQLSDGSFLGVQQVESHSIEAAREFESRPVKTQRAY